MRQRRCHVSANKVPKSKHVALRMQAMWWGEKTGWYTDAYPQRPSPCGRVWVSESYLRERKCQVRALVQSPPQRKSCIHLVGTSIMLLSPSSNYIGLENFVILWQDCPRQQHRQVRVKMICDESSLLRFTKFQILIGSPWTCQAANLQNTLLGTETFYGVLQKTCPFLKYCSIFWRLK